MDKNESTVLFLGAGASKHFGYPLTNEILGITLERAREQKLFTESTYFKVPDFGSTTELRAFPRVLETRTRQQFRQMLLERLGVLYPGLLSTNADLPEITNVLSLIDHLLANEEASSPWFQPKYLQELRELLERAIMEVLDKPVVKDKLEQGRTQLNKLVTWILNHQGDNQQPITIITTNYDTLVEQEIYDRFKWNDSTLKNLELAQSVDFGFPWRDPYAEVIHYPVAMPKVRILKLHGSLNWLKCDLCGHIYISTFEQIYELAYHTNISEANSCHCGHAPLRPVIVAPSMVRNVREPNLLAIWQRALEALRTSTRWVMIGYSLPNEDLAIRSILMRADRGHASTKKVDVYQFDDKAKSRYEMLFPGCNYQLDGMEAFIGSLK